jgi:hypothetical protein
MQCPLVQKMSWPAFANLEFQVENADSTAWRVARRYSAQ